MAELSVTNFNGINTYLSPFSAQDGNTIHCLNLSSPTNSTRIKREGYNSILNNPDSSQVNSLFSWMKDDGTTFYTYRASGSSLYYSLGGTANWALAGGGTITNNSHVTAAVLNNVLVVGDGAGTPKYSTNGTSFSDLTGAPIGGHDPVTYQGRIYMAGTASYYFYSTTGTATDWVTDSSSLLADGSGTINTLFKASDRLIIAKNSGAMYRWDGASQVDMATKLGPASPFSVGEIEDFRLFPNRKGIFITNGNKPQLISNPIQRQIFNQNDTGIANSLFDTLVGGINEYEYFTTMGTVTDDFTNIQINNAILSYDYKNNQFMNYQFAHYPTAFHSYKDLTGKQQFIFGDATGQVYQFANTATSDAGKAIEASIIVMLTGNMPHVRKDFRAIEFFTNPGCQAMVQFAVEDIVPSSQAPGKVSGPRQWVDLCSLVRGYTYVSFPPETRGRIMYLRIYEAGTGRPWELFSLHYKFDPIAM